jgi:hypothetical protein
MEYEHGRGNPIASRPRCRGHPLGARSFVLFAAVYTGLCQPEILRAIRAALA